MTTNLPPMPNLLSVDDAAKQLSVSTKTIRRLVKTAALPSHRIGRLVRISAADLAAFAASRRR